MLPTERTATPEPLEAADRAGRVVREQIASITEAAQSSAINIERAAEEAGEAARRSALEGGLRIAGQISQLESELDNLRRSVANEADGLRVKLDRSRLHFASAPSSASKALPSEGSPSETGLPAVAVESEPSKESSRPEVSEPAGSVESEPSKESSRPEVSEPAGSVEDEPSHEVEAETVVDDQKDLPHPPDDEAQPEEAVSAVDDKQDEVDSVGDVSAVEEPIAADATGGDSAPVVTPPIPETSPPDDDRPDAGTAEAAATDESQVEGEGGAVEELAFADVEGLGDEPEGSDEAASYEPSYGGSDPGASGPELSSAESAAFAEARTRAAQASDLELAELYAEAKAHVRGGSDEAAAAREVLVAVTIEEAVGRPDFGVNPGGSRREKKQRAKLLQPLTIAREEALAGGRAAPPDQQESAEPQAPLEEALAHQLADEADASDGEGQLSDADDPGDPEPEIESESDSGDEEAGEGPAAKGGRRRFRRRNRPFIEVEGECSVCGRAFAAGEEPALAQSGWLVRGHVGLCPEDQEAGWRLSEGTHLPYKPGGAD